MYNELVFQKINQFNFSITTNFDSKRFNIFSFHTEILENFYFAQLIINGELFKEIEIIEKDKELYYKEKNRAQNLKAININKNELILLKISEHKDFNKLLNQIKKMKEAYL